MRSKPARCFRMLGVVPLVVLPACLGEPRPVAIGYVLPGSWDQDVAAVVRDALDSLPWARELNLELVADTTVTGGLIDQEIEAAERLVETPRLVGVVGHGGSRESLVAAPVYNEAGIVQLVPTGTSRMLRDAGEWTFALPPDDSLEGEFLAEQAVARHAPRFAAIFYVNDEYGDGLRASLVGALSRRGVRVVEQVPVGTGGDFGTLVQAAFRRARPDVVFVAARTPATARIARAIHGIDPRLPILAGDGAFIFPHLLEASGPAGRQLAVVGFWDPAARDSLSRAFVERFRRVTGANPHPSHAMAYDALMLLATAAAEVGPRPGAVRRYLLELGDSRPPYRGVTGDIVFGPERPARFVLVDLGPLMDRDPG